MTVDFRSVTSTVNDYLTAIEKEIDQIIARDENDAISAHNRINTSNSCPADELQRFKDDCQELIDKLNALRGEPRKAWDAWFKNHAHKPADLHAIDTQYDLLDKKLAVLQDEVAGMAQQTHWQGQGADAYMKELPYQNAALAELRAFTLTERDGLNRAAQLHQGVMQAVQEHLKQTKMRLQGIKGSAQTGDIYFQRTADAIAVMEYSRDWLKDVKEGQTWDYSVSELGSAYTRAEGNLHMFAKKDIWPSATDSGGPSLPTQPLPPTTQIDPSTTGTGTPTQGGGDVSNQSGGPGINVTDKRYD